MNDRTIRDNLRRQDQASIDALNTVSEALNAAARPEAPFTLPPSPIRLAQAVATTAVAISIRTLTAHVYVGLTDIADAIRDNSARRSADD